LGRSAIVVAIAAACSSARETTIASKPASGPPASRDALVAATLSAISAGDDDALAKLADVDAVAARALACDAAHDNAAERAKARERSRELVARVKREGARVELARIDSDKRARVVEVGQVLGERCIAKVRLVFHDLRLDLDVTTANEKKVVYVRLFALEADGAWFLAIAPGLDGSFGDFMRKLHELRDKMCACKDMACANAVIDELTRWSAEHAGDPTAESLEEVGKAGFQVARQMSECMERVRGATP
jgi:hypothetical protein